VKGLIPAIANQLSPREFEGFITEIQLKGDRFHEAQSQKGEGRAKRQVPGERDLEGR
jgi:hypothetical protein